MKVIVCTGSPGSNLISMSDTMTRAGISGPVPTTKNDLTPALWHGQVLRDFGNEPFRQSSQLKPNGLWEDQARAILQSNAQQNLWGWTDSLTTWLLDFWKELSPEIYFVLTYADPEYEYAYGIETTVKQEKGSKDFIDVWLEYNQQVLRFYNRNMARSVLVNSSTCIRDPEEFIKLCNDKFDIELDKNISNDSAKLSPIRPVASVLSSNEVSERSDIKELQLEMNATASLPGIFIEDKVSHKARVEYQTLIVSNQEMSARLKELEQKQVQAVIQDNNEREKIKDELSLLKESHEELTTENKLLYAQLHDVRKELKYYYDICQRLEQKKNAVLEGRYSIGMDEVVDGDNWYDAEVDNDGAFRWTGPECKTSINIPVKIEKESLLLINYRNTQTRDQLKKNTG